MLNWIVRHIDAIQDNYDRMIHTEEFQDWAHIKEVIKFLSTWIYKRICFLLYITLSIISLFISWLLLWCLFRG